MTDLDSIDSNLDNLDSHDWVTSLSLSTFMHWRRKWQPTPVFLPGESQGEPGGLPSMGSHRVGHDWRDLAANSILKSWDITLSTKFHLVKSMVFPVVMYGCQSWTIKKAECRRIDAFELWCVGEDSWESLVLQGDPTSPGCSLDRLMLKLKLQYFGHLMWRADSFEKILMLGKIEGRRRRGQQRMRWLDGITE